MWFPLPALPSTKHTAVLYAQDGSTSHLMLLCGHPKILSSSISWYSHCNRGWSFTSNLCGHLFQRLYLYHLVSRLSNTLRLLHTFKIGTRSATLMSGQVWLPLWNTALVSLDHSLCVLTQRKYFLEDVTSTVLICCWPQLFCQTQLAGIHCPREAKALLPCWWALASHSWSFSPSFLFFLKKIDS